MTLLLVVALTAAAAGFVAGCLYEHLRSYDLLRAVNEPPSNVRTSK